MFQRYDPPANWNDFSGRPTESTFRAVWHDFIFNNFVSNIQGLRNTGIQRPLFFSEAQASLAQTPPDVPISWDGFPKVLTLLIPDDRQAMMQASETLQPLGSTGLTFRPQDEYLEWHAVRGANGRIQRFVFTAEGPEYWERLAKVDPELLVKLYKELVDPKIELADLVVKKSFRLRGKLYKVGDYNPWNSYNTDKGCVHLTHPSNTLGAEINLAAFASVQRLDANRNLISDPRRLACCSSFGEPNRSSDPTIGQTVNLTVRGGVSVTLSNPVGLYIGKINLNAARGPNGEKLDGWWRITRGVEGRGLRAEFGPPPGAAFGIQDVRVRNEALTHGGQIAELIKVVLYAHAVNLGVPDSPAFACENRCCMPEGTAEPELAVLEWPIEVGTPCPPGMEDAYPELTVPSTPRVFNTRSSKVDAALED